MLSFMEMGQTGMGKYSALVFSNQFSSNRLGASVTLESLQLTRDADCSRRSTVAYSPVAHSPVELGSLDAPSLDDINTVDVNDPR